jgi:DNA-binding response OmpR family regulator
MGRGGRPELTRAQGQAVVVPQEREPGQSLRAAVVLSAVEEGAGEIVAGLARRGVEARRLACSNPDLRRHMLSPRPDLVIVHAATAPAWQAAEEALSPLVASLQALAVPVLAAVPPAIARSGTLLTLADDVVLPPHDPEEALLRAALVARRRGNAETHLLSAGPLTLDVEGFRAWLAGAPLPLTYIEFQLLRMLLLNRGKVLTRDTLLDRIWGHDYLGGLRTVDVHIRRLRAKLEAEAPTLIETVRNVGYRLMA